MTVSLKNTLDKAGNNVNVIKSQYWGMSLPILVSVCKLITECHDFPGGKRLSHYLNLVLNGSLSSWNVISP